MLIFGMNVCPDCVEARKILDGEKIAYMYKEITESTGAMKQFLKFRDSRDEFQKIKESGSIGVPCFLMDDKRIFFDIDEVLRSVKS